MSNAHVVAGAETVTVEADGQTYDATVVSYDPDADISILDVPDLPSAPLRVRRGSPRRPAPTHWCSGYPGGGDFQATPARVRETIELKGPDIYKSKTVDREVYTIRGTVRQGNSGGPMINRQGEVLGVVFGAAVDDAETGFVLTTKEVDHQLGRIGNTAAGRHRHLRYANRGPRLIQEARQVVVDRLGRLFVSEMSCACD